MADATRGAHPADRGGTTSGGLHRRHLDRPRISAGGSGFAITGACRGRSRGALV